MSHRYRFDVRSSALLAACLGLLASPLACQSDEQDDAADAATTEVDSLGAGNAGAGAGAGMASSSGNPPAGAAARQPPASEPPAVQNLAPPAPASTPTTSPAAPAAAVNAAAAPIVFEACTYSEGNYGRNCDSLYVTMKQVSPARCVQLTFDNCGEYGRGGLPVDVPMPWRMDSGAVGSNLEQCELGVFYPNSAVALRASGSATWNETTRLPSELVLDVTLETSTSAGAASVEVITTTPLTPFVCND